MSRKTYSGIDVDVSFDGDVCQHAENCIRGLPSVFDVDHRPWIVPDGAPPDDVVAQVGRCPSGALQIERRS